MATTKTLKQDEDLSITFIQIGDNQAAGTWLKMLDDDLHTTAEFDVVDTMTCQDLKGTSFKDVITASVRD